MPRAKQASVHNVDMITTMLSRPVAIIKKKIESLNLAPSQSSTQQIIYCDFCSGEHLNLECPSMGTLVEQIHARELAGATPIQIHTIMVGGITHIFLGEAKGSSDHSNFEDFIVKFHSVLAL